MGKIKRRIGICMLAAVCLWCCQLLGDRAVLREELIRLHVVANSDSQEDQQIKLRVRDAVLKSIQRDLKGVTDKEAASAYLQENLPKLQRLAQNVLYQAGVDSSAAVTLCREAFDTRYYDTFTLPAGIYESLRIVIGEGQGHNWWCVAFPSLCTPGTEEEFQAAAAGAGFSDTLTKTLAGETYEIRFFLLDQLGRLENILWEG